MRIDILDKSNVLNMVRVVLSHTTHPGNIGAAARAMKTMGLESLYLVNPRHFPDAQANTMSAGADDVLRNTVVCGSIDEALQGTVFVAAMTARLRDISHEVLTPREAMPLLAQHAAQGQVALLFGTEMAGLTNEEMGKSHVLVRIPANPQYSSLNLAAAVQVACYELSVAMQYAGLNLRQIEVEPAKHEEMERFFVHLEDVLIQIGFFNTKHPNKLMQKLRRLYARARLEQEEINILRGVLTATTEYNTRDHNGHGKCTTPDNETCHARFPHPNPPPKGEGANESLREFYANGHGKCTTPDNETCHARFPHPNPPPKGEGANESLREFYANDEKNGKIAGK